MDLNSDVSNLSCGRIRVEQRVIFEIQLPNGFIVSVRSKPSTISAKVLNPILIEFNRQFEPELYEIRFVSHSVITRPLTLTLHSIPEQTDTWDQLVPEWPIFCADNRKLIVLYRGTNETKSLANDRISTIERENLFLREFFDQPIDSMEFKKEFEEFNICDISFSDDHKSEEFFNDLMRSTQTVPKDTKDISKIVAKSHKNIPNNENFLQNLLILSENSDTKKFVPRMKLKSPKLKIIDFQKRSQTILKSDQLYDKRVIRRSDKTEDDNIENADCNASSRLPEDKCRMNGIKTLSKYHKTSREELLRTSDRVITSNVNAPDLFEFKFTSKNC